MSDAIYAFNVGVVGRKDIMSEVELAGLLDLLVNRHIGTRRIVLLSPGNGPACLWAKTRGYHLQIVPECGNAVRQDCEFVFQSDAIVILGDPAPWQRLIDLCKEADIPVRIYRTRPKPVKTSPQAWEVT